MMHEALLALVLMPSAQQSEHSQGNLMGAPLTVFVDSGTAGDHQLVPSEGHMKRVGARTVPPILHPVLPGRPDFRNGPWTQVAGIIDAFSTNLNWISSSATGAASAAIDGGQGWAGIVVSVTDTTIGSAGSTLRAEADVNDVAADMFQYLFADSVGVPTDLIDKTLRAIDSFETRLTSTTATANIIAFDLFVPILLGEPDTIGQILDEFKYVAFSVDTATAMTPNAVPSAWWGSEAPSGAIVFRTQWTGTHWTIPAPWLLPVALGLANTDDVDAFAYDNKHGYVLFSTTSAALDPIMFHNLTTGHVGAFIDSTSNQPISTRIGLRPTLQADDTDALCAVDPRITDFLRYVATPLPAVATLSASAWRESNESAKEAEIVVLVSGSVAPVEEEGESGGFVLKLFGGLVPDPDIEIAAQPISTLSGIIEHRVTALPFVGYPVYLQWKLFDEQNAELAASPVLSMRL